MILNSTKKLPADKTTTIGNIKFLPEIIKQRINADNTSLTALDSKIKTGVSGIVNEEFDKILGYIVHLSQK